jgi:hypothetical protein
MISNLTPLSDVPLDVLNRHLKSLYDADWEDKRGAIRLSADVKLADLSAVMGDKKGALEIYKRVLAAVEKSGGGDLQDLMMVSRSWLLRYGVSIKICVQFLSCRCDPAFGRRSRERACPDENRG